MSNSGLDGLRFECTACGRCCTGEPGGTVRVSSTEADAIRRRLRMGRLRFRRRYLVRLRNPAGDGLRIGADGRCVMLSEDGICRIYTERPMQCRTYPFWPEVVASESAWRAECRRCEGIDRGAVIPRQQWEAVSARQEAYDRALVQTASARLKQA